MFSSLKLLKITWQLHMAVFWENWGIIPTFPINRKNNTLTLVLTLNDQANNKIFVWPISVICITSVSIIYWKLFLLMGACPFWNSFFNCRGFFFINKRATQYTNSHFIHSLPSFDISKTSYEFCAKVLCSACFGDRTKQKEYYATDCRMC